MIFKLDWSRAARRSTCPGFTSTTSTRIRRIGRVSTLALIWLSQAAPLLRTLLRRFAETGLRRRWLEYDAARDWLPAHDQAELQRLEQLTAQRRA